MLMPKPSLQDAYTKRDRGHEHLVELDALVIKICNDQAKRIVIKPRPNVSIPPGHAGVIADTDWGERVEIPDRCRVLAGDAANSFRSSLDYLVGQLAVLDSGPGNRRTQFPIEDSPGVFGKRRKTYLAGLSNVHVDVIARLQPCNGCDWTKNLAMLSNLDKHNKLVFLGHAVEYRLTSTQRPENTAGTTPIRPRVKMEFQAVLQIALRDGLPLKETLQVIEIQVTQTLDAFKPEFQ